jgi:hypothetical protein
MIKSVFAAAFAVSDPTVPSPADDGLLQQVTDKKFNDNGHMITIGVNFHF